MLSDRAAVNSTDGVDVAEQNVVFNYRQKGDQPLTANAYLINEMIERWAEFTTAPTNTELPGQALNAERRIVFGGSIEKYFLWPLPGGMSADLLLGLGEKSTFAREATFNTIRRSPVGAESNAVDFSVHNPFGYAQLDFKPVPWIKLTGGLRYDFFFYDVNDIVNRVGISPALAVDSPKAGLSVAPVAGLDFFLNFGQGFRPPDPYFELSFNPHLPVSKNATEEAGLQ
ncbi:MAG TPA: TonB-dependent receptor [Chthoniobacterales bacterium]